MIVVLSFSLQPFPPTCSNEILMGYLMVKANIMPVFDGDVTILLNLCSFP